LITPYGKGICHMQANAYANGKLVQKPSWWLKLLKKP
jgi:hypothetical protein